MKRMIVAALGTTALWLSPAMAQDSGPYVSASIGLNTLGDSDNEGGFSQDFTIAGTALDGTTLPTGTDVGWTTEFDSGFTGSIAGGMHFGGFRGEVELAFAQNDVDTHKNVSAAGLDLTDVDATVLVAGVSDDLGITTGDLVADGQGELSATYLMLNGYTDFGPSDARIRPYVGAGVGIGFVTVDFSPSDTVIIDDDQSVFAYQLMAGATAMVAENVSAFGELSYRATDDIEVDADLFPAALDIENRAFVAEIGIRYDFGM